MEKVSVIIPVYNTSEYIKECIDSVINQTYKNLEIIIIDDNSTDDSLKIIKSIKDKRIKIITLKKNVGVANARNAGLKKATGDYICFLDSDDYYIKDKIEKQIEFIKGKEFIYTGYSYLKNNRFHDVHVPKKLSYNEAIKNTTIFTSTVMFDARKISKELFIMPDLQMGEDSKTWWKILKTGITAYGIDEVLTIYRVGKTSLSSNKFLSVIRTWKIYKMEKLNPLKRVYCYICYIKNAIIRRVPRINFKRIKEIIHLLSFKQIIDFFLFPFILIISKLLKPLCSKDIWIIEENPNEACDNGYILFKYLKKNRKDINAYYVIKRKSKDYDKVKKLGKVIRHASLKHWVYYLNSKRIIVTQKYANPSPALFHVLHKKELIKNPRIFLQHGIIKDYCDMFKYERTKFRLFVCGAKREYEYLVKSLDYPEGYLIYTGLARFDNLIYNKKTKDKLILIAPTWRNWVKTQKQFDAFLDNYNKLLNDKKLIKTIEKNNIKLQFVMHKNMSKFKLNIKSPSNNILINHNEEVDIQDLINETDLLITDCSSLFFDIAYRKRPIIYYQFDMEEFRKKQLQEGYFSYENDGFGEVYSDSNHVIDKIKYYIDNDFKIEKKYLDRINSFYERRDKNNCKRIVEKIEMI